MAVLLKAPSLAPAWALEHAKRRLLLANRSPKLELDVIPSLSSVLLPDKHTQGCRTELVRADLQGGLFSGSKTHKMHEVMQMYLCANPSTAQLEQPWVVVGGAASNSLVAATHHLRRKGIEVHAAILGIKAQAAASASPNFSLLRLLLPPRQMHWLQEAGGSALPGDGGAAVRAALAGSLPNAAVGHLSSYGDPVVWEGCLQPGGIVGAGTLLPSIPDGPCNVVVDAGTGATAAGLAGAMASSPAHVGSTLHIVQVAGSMSGLLQVLGCGLDLFGSGPVPVHPPGEWGREVQKGNHAPLHIFLHRPQVGASFGSVPSTVVRASVTLARQVGVLADPVYTAKLLHSTAEMQACAPQTAAAQPWYVVHEGGSLALVGHEARLHKAARQLDGEG